MSLRLMVRSGLMLSLLAVTTLTYANTDGDKIPCPSASKIQQAAIEINRASRNRETQLFFASTSTPAIYENGLGWSLGVDRIFANSVEEAIKIGQKNGQETSYQRNQYAFQGEDGLTCFYGPGEIQAVVLK